MTRKADSNSNSENGFNDVIGFVLLGLAVLLLVAQFSFDRYDLAFVHNPPNHPAHNWIGILGAWLAYSSFFLFGAAAYLLPWLFLAFGLSHLPGILQFFRLHRVVEALEHLAERWRSQVFWAAALVFAVAGVLHLADTHHWLLGLRGRICAPSVGGWLGYTAFEYAFWMLSLPGSAIVYGTLGIVSLLFLTNFRIGGWMHLLLDWWTAASAEDKNKSSDEIALERRARELERERKKLEKEAPAVAPAAAPMPSGLGADGQPVPEPTVRDLSVPSAKQVGRYRKTTQPSQPKPLPAPSDDEALMTPAKEVAAATTAEILGREPEKTSKPAEPMFESASTKEEKVVAEKAEAKPEAKPEAEKPAEPEKKTEPAITISGLAPARPRPAPKPRKPMSVASVPMIGNYQLPLLDFLQHPDMTVKPTESKEELMANARLMQQTLAQFEIEVSLGDITKGPTITRYELHPAPGVKLEKIAALSNNLAAVLKAERINILAPVPGKSSVGIEVPNSVKTKVIMRDLFESDEWRNTKAKLPIALGKDVYGHPIIADLSEMPHVLIAGATGAGKSVCINSIIASLLYRFTPDQLRFVMIDPKVVELQQYNVLPHLVVPVVTDPKKVILALRWVVNEMEKRYQIFARVGVRNVGSFNSRPKNKPLPQAEMELPLMAKKEKVEPGADGFAVEVDEEIVVPREEDIVIPEKLSYIVVIIDELADLMLVAPADVEMAIARITQMARAAGIHCIVATQRPSVDVITGVIKANIPARIAFQVASSIDSRTILDTKGGEKLLGKGDMLFLPPGSAKLIRAQGALITDHELASIVEFIAKQAKPSYEMEIHQQLSKPSNTFGGESGIDEDEEIVQQCIEVIRSEQKASVSLLQRRLKLGYGRAARIMDELENRQIVGPNKGAEPRDILIDLDGGGADGGDQEMV